MKKTLSILLALTLCLGSCFALAACSGKDSSSAKYEIGIVQIVEHPALDAATAGFKQAVIDELGADMVKFNYQNAQNDANTCSTIVNQFVSNNVDLIMANATPALQAAAAATGDIPILGTSVTEYGVALDLSDFNGTVGGNISGTSDLAPLDAQAAMIAEWFPDAQSVGLLYCSKEANSKYQVDVMKAELEAKGLTVSMHPFSDSNDLAQICTTAAANCDVIYVPTDNTVANNATAIDSVCRPAGIPIIAGEAGVCAGCGIATLSIDYYDLGYATGKMAVRILKDGEDITKMPIEYAPEVSYLYNEEICKELNITPLAGYNKLVTE